jgi:uncharacterized phage protein gp47/JayE
MFVPRAFETILTDMVAHVRANSTITDFTIGSNIRTLLEAAALEDDEQYYQMVQLLADFSFNSASGSDLDKRAADFNIVRLAAAPASGHVRFRNEALTKSTVQFNVLAGALSVYAEDSSDFPTSGFPYTIRLGEGTPQVEDVTVSANNTSTGVFTTSALLSAHNVGDIVSLVVVTGSAVSSGIQVQVAAQGNNLPIIFTTIESATMVDGNYYSNLVRITATDDGSLGNVSASKVSQFSGGAPFPGASVTNPADIGGGRDRETDREFRDRIKLKIQELAKGTRTAVEGAVKGLEDQVTGQRVVTTKLIESFTDLEHKLFIDDGTGFVPSSVVMARTTMTAPTLVGVASIPVTSVLNFPASGHVLISPENVVQVEIMHYSAKDAVANTLIFDTPTVTVNAHDAVDEVLLVDYLGTAELGQNYFQLTQYPLKKNTIELYDNSSGSYRLRTLGVDYLLNRTNGQIEYYGAGLPAGTKVFANYSYYTGLLALAQKVVNGDPKDVVNYPGAAAGGVILYVDVPSIRAISVIASISADAGYDEDLLKSNVQSAIENYINGLSIGDNVILSRMIERSFTVRGVSNVFIKSPLFDIVVLENELAKSYDSSGNSLVRVI